MFRLAAEGALRILLRHVAVPEELGALRRRVGRHVVDRIDTRAVCRALEEGSHELLGHLPVFLGHKGALAHAETDVAEGEDLEVREENILGAPTGQIFSGLKHLVRVALDIDFGDGCERLCGRAVPRRAGWRTEHQSVRENCREHESRDFLRRCQVLLLHDRIDNGIRTADRLVPEVGRAAGLQIADSVVIDDLENVRLLHAVHGLRELVVVHQNDPLRVQI